MIFQRLASYSDWTLVVVGDTKTPADWNLPDVHYLSIETQVSDSSLKLCYCNGKKRAWGQVWKRKIVNRPRIGMYLMYNDCRWKKGIFERNSLM